MEQPKPPPYVDPKGYDASDIILPGILVLAGQLIHSESASSQVLYELDRNVSFLSRADHKVAFSRHEPLLRINQHGEVVRATDYQRHIFNLEYPHAITSTSPYAFFLTSVSRKAMGNVGLKKTSKLGFKVMRINRSEDEELFEITRKDGRYEWWDTWERRIAIEDNANGQLKMIITTALPRQKVEVLVAMWCLRLWHDAALDVDTSILDSVKRKLGMRK